MLCDRINPLPAAYRADPKAYVGAVKMRLLSAAPVVDPGIMSAEAHHHIQYEKARAAATALARKQLREQLYRRATFLTVAVQVAAAHFGASVDEAMQNKKTKKAALARQTVMDIGRCDHRIGLRQLAEFFATSTQTVAYSLAKIANRKKSDPEYAEDRAEIVRLIKWMQDAR